MRTCWNSVRRAGGEPCGTTDGPGRQPTFNALASEYQAGYRTDNNVDFIDFVSVNATFVVPKVTCAASYSSTDFGLEDDPSGSAPNYHYASAVVLADCLDGKARYEANAVVGDQGRGFVVDPGDTVVVSVFMAYPDAEEEARVSDLTTDTYVTGQGTDQTGAMNLGAFSTIPTEEFNKVTFTKVQVNGLYLNMEPTTEFEFGERVHHADQDVGDREPG